MLERIADLLEAQDASVWRQRAYRNSAETVRNLGTPVWAVAQDQGVEGLDRLQAIGEGIARLIIEYVDTGRSSLLDRLEGEVSPEAVLARVGGIGEELAHRINTELGVDSLEELEQAAHDGRLASLPGFGPRRTQTVRDSLAGIFSRAGRRRAVRTSEPVQGLLWGREEPPVQTLLAVDVTYRRRAEAGRLRTIAPRRHNPEARAWLPVFHTERDGWDFTALYSNTARAHELGATRDWVLIFFERDGQSGQRTVVTGTGGVLSGRRVVRGRESECRAYYSQRTRRSA